VADATMTTEGVAVSLDPRVNDSDPDGDALTVTGHGSGAHGTVSCTATACTYSPVFGFVGTDSFGYTITDTHGATATATVTITVLNQAPVAVADARSTTEGVAVSLDPRTNDSDPDGDAITITANGSATHGPVSCTATACTYSPAFGFVGTDSYSYTITDTHGATATATVTVTVLNQAPVAAADVASTFVKQAVTIPVAANDSDPDGDAITVTGHGTPAHGTVSCASATCTYTPAASYAGADAFSYTITDTHAGVSSATVTVTVVDRAPTPVDDSAGTPGATAVVIPVIANDTDPDVDALIVVAHTSAAHGRLTCGTTNCTYTPAAGFVGTDGFRYTARDPYGLTGTAVVSIGVTDRAPVAADDDIHTDKATTVVVAVLGNDSDPDGDAVTVASAAQGTHGAVSCTSTTCSYTPEAGFAGSDSFSYTISDGRGATSTAIVRVTVGNRAPVFGAELSNDSQSIAVGTVPAAMLAHDPDGDVLTYVVSSGALPAGVTLSPDGSFGGSATTNGRTTAVIKASDADGLFDTTTLSVLVGNSPQTAAADSAGTTQAQPVTVPVLANDADVDGDPLAVSSHGAAAHGAVVCTAAACTYTPDAAYAGGDNFSYTTTDGNGHLVSAAVTLTVLDVAPKVGDDAASTPRQTAVTVPVTANDSDYDSFTVTAGSSAAHGTVACSATDCTYTPTGAYAGADGFTYTVTDSYGMTSVGAVTIDVQATNRPPVVSAAATNTSQNVAVGSPLTALAATDLDGDSLSFSLVSGSLPPGVALLGGGGFSGAPTAWGDYVSTIQVTDGRGGLDTTTLTVHVPNRPVQAVDDKLAARSGQPATVRPLANDVDPDGDALAISSVGTPAHGTMSCASGVCTYTAKSGYVGSDSVSYVVTDGQGHTDTGLVSITVTLPPNYPPVAVNDSASTWSGAKVVVNALANDTDPDHDVLSIIGHSASLHGAVTCTTTCTYAAATTYSGADSFTYTISDGHGHTRIGTVKVTVVFNRAPIVRADTASTVGTRTVTSRVLANDTDPDGDALRIVKHGPVAYGTVSCTTTTCSYTAKAGWYGTIKYSYTVSDAHGHTATAVVTVTVNRS
jgi:hypothetical protein